MPRTTIRHFVDISGLPVHEVERLLMRVTGLGRADLIAGVELDEVQQRRFDELVDRRQAGEPLQYLEGSVEFGPIEVIVDRRALVPRPETEYLWELAVGAVTNPEVIVDLGTGSGGLALALKHQFPTARVLAAEISSDALTLARANAARLGLEIEFFEGDLFEPLPGEVEGTVGLLVSNPPYVAGDDFAELPVEVREYEPRQALVAGPTGNEVIARIAGEVRDWLSRGGWFFCEISEKRPSETLELFGESLDARVAHDLTGRPRYVIGRKS